MKKRVLPFALLVTSLFVFTFSIPISAQVYVKWDAAGGNGTSWADAFTDLQDALNAAPAGSEIWVAAGTYKPAGVSGSPASTFLINKNLQLLGGFDGMETSVDQRDPYTNVTTLSGDLNENDVEDDFEMNREDNVRNVIWVENNVTNETLIDGFTITGGHADGSGLEGAGGGIFCRGYPVIRHCIFEQNFALVGGGAVRLHITNSKVEFEFCQFNRNQANVGGAMNSQVSTYSLMQCSFLSNRTVAGAFQANGGGLSSFASYGSLYNCLFAGNSAFAFGGGIAVFTSTGIPLGSLSLQGCTLADNQGQGSIAIASADSIFLQNTILYNPGYSEYSGNINNASSLGGNLFRDMSLQAILGPSDKQGLDPLFAGSGDYRLSGDSPCIDMGLTDGITAQFDLDGKARIIGNSVDIGAYEWGISTPVKEVVIEELKVSPNPATGFLNIQFPEHLPSKLEAHIFDLQGRLVWSQSIDQRQILDLRELVAGFYSLKVVAGKRILVGKFIKLKTS